MRRLLSYSSLPLIYQLQDQVHAGNREIFVQTCRLMSTYSVNGSDIEYVTNFKLLGVTVDQDLSLNIQTE